MTVLAGQAWSLLTFTPASACRRSTSTRRKPSTELRAGFNWARQPQFRIEKSFPNDQYWLAMSIENPQTTYSQTSIPSSLGSLNISNAGIGVDATTLSYTNISRPMSSSRASSTPPLRIWKGYALGRVFNDRLSQLGTGESKTVLGGGGRRRRGADPHHSEFPRIRRERHGRRRHRPLRHGAVARRDHRRPRPARAAARMDGDRRHRRSPRGR